MMDIVTREKYDALYNLYLQMADERNMANQRIAALEEQVAAGAWLPVRDTPNDKIDTDYLGWDGFRYQVITYKPDADFGDTSWPWRDWFDDDVTITHYQPLPDAPQQSNPDRPQ